MLNRLLRFERRSRGQSQVLEVACERARTQLEAGDLAGVRTSLQEALAAAEAQGTGWLVIGRIQAQVDPELALLTLRRATEVPAEATEAFGALGRLALAVGRLPEAITALSAALWSQPGDHASRQVLATALLRSGRLAEAQEEVRLLQARRPDDVEVWRLRVEVASRLPSLDERIAALTGALTVVPDDFGLLRHLVDVLDLAGRPREGTERLASAARRQPALLLELGRRQSMLSDPGARATLEAAVALPDSPAEAFYLLGRLEQIAQQHREAVGNFRRALNQGLRIAEVYCGLAWSLYEQGEAPGALNIVLQGLMVHRGEPRLTSLLTRIQGATPAGPVTSITTEQVSGLAGGLDTVALADLLEFFRMNRRTGTLRLTAHHGVAEIHMIEGELASVSSSNVPRLGEALIAQGLLTRSQVDPLVLEGEELLGRRLVDDRLISTEALRQALYDQATTAMTDLIGWKEGQFVFRTDESLRQRIPPGFELNTTQVLLDAMRWLDERSVS